MDSKDITDIIYDTTRGLHGVDDRMSIASIFLFCCNHDSELFAELLYTDNHQELIEKLNKDYSNYKVDFSVRLDNVDVKRCFTETLARSRVKFDANGYYKALFNKDPFALAVRDIINFKP